MLTKQCFELAVPEQLDGRLLIARRSLPFARMVRTVPFHLDI
jgi:hypothetical protein